jgi:O-glycosyl hydrolase
MVRAGICVFLLVSAAYAQPETMAWGNLNGIRVDGQLLELNSSMCVAQPEWAAVSRTGRERQTNTYKRTGNVETVTIQMQPSRPLRAQGATWSFAATETVEETGPGAAKIGVEYSFPKGGEIGGAYYCLELPASLYSGGSVQLTGAEAPVSLNPGPNDRNEYLHATATGAKFTAPRRSIEVTFEEPTEIVIRDDRRSGSYDLQVYFAVVPGKPKSFAVKLAGEPDTAPVTIAVDAAHPGQMFDGLGGNFRLQNPRTDAAVIQYNLDNLRVAWGRVELPWAIWQPNEETDPLEEARAGRIDPRVAAAMEMARTLARKGVPVIVSAWSAPAWAVLGTGPRGNPLNPEKAEKIKASIAGYLIHLKEKYGVEAAMFTFNESDIGINVHQTPREHAETIKTFGRYFAARGLATKLALGDTSDANPIDFIKPAMADPEAVQYIGAVDFHSWRGCTDELLAAWRDAARALDVPLIVAEGSTDAAAYRYPQIFQEPSFAFYEINLYTRILSIAQPRSILQWQLTADYSLLAGGGIFGDTAPLRPTQRFWNLKQFAATPPRSFTLPAKCGGPALTCAALGNIAEGVYTVNVVNNGPRRAATVTGLPAEVKQLHVWVTDAKRGMEQGAAISVTDGKAQLMLEPTSFTTLIGGPI